MATLLELRDQIIIDAGIEGNPHFPVLRLNKIINLAQYYVQRQLNGLGLKKWEASSTLNLNSDTFMGISIKSAPIMSDIIESPKSIKFIDVNDGATYGIAYEVEPKFLAEQLSNSYLMPTISKPIYSRLAGKILISPATVTNATAYYYKRAKELVNDTDSTEIPIEYEEFIIKRSVVEINQILGKLNDKQQELIQIDKEIAESFQAINNNILAENYINKEEKAQLQ